MDSAAAVARQESTSSKTTARTVVGKGDSSKALTTVAEEPVEESSTGQESRVASDDVGERTARDERLWKHNAHVQMLECVNSSRPTIIMSCIVTDDVNCSEKKENGAPSANENVTVIAKDSELSSHHGSEGGTSEQRPLISRSHVRMFEYWNSPSPINDNLSCCHRLCRWFLGRCN